MNSGMKYIMETQQWLIILNVKYTFFSDLKVLLLHSPTWVQTDGLFFKNSFSHFIGSNNTSSMILELKDSTMQKGSTLPAQSTFTRWLVCGASVLCQEHKC